MKSSSLTWQYLRQAMLYLFKPGILLYWLAYAVVSGLVNIRTLQTIIAAHAEAPPEQWVQMQQGQNSAASWINIVFFILLFYKTVDCIVRIARGQQQNVPFQLLTLAPPSMALKYFCVLLLPVWCVWAVLPAALAMLCTAGIFFLTPAMIILLVQHNNIRLMLSPQNWRKTILAVGKSHYLLILFMPMLAALGAGLSCGIVFAVILSSIKLQSAQLLVCMQGFLAVLKAYFLILPAIYCAFFIPQSETAASAALSADEQRVLSDARTRKMSLNEQKAFARDLLRADSLCGQNQAMQAAECLRPYLRNPATAECYLPAYQRLQTIYRNTGNIPELQDIEYLMIQAAAQGQERFYPHIQSALSDLAAHDLSRLPVAWRPRLVQTAIGNRHYDLVLLLTRDFAAQFEGSYDAVEIGYYRAQALDKLGERAQSLQILRDLLAEYPKHAQIARVQRAYDALQGLS